MSSSTGESWEQVHERRKSEEDRKSIGVIAECAFGSCWGITLIYTYFLGTHQGWSEVFNYSNPEWTFFNLSTIGWMIIGSIIVTIINVIIKIVNRKIE